MKLLRNTLILHVANPRFYNRDKSCNQNLGNSRMKTLVPSSCHYHLKRHHIMCLRDQQYICCRALASVPSSESPRCIGGSFQFGELLECGVHKFCAASFAAHIAEVSAFGVSESMWSELCANLCVCVCLHVWFFAPPHHHRLSTRTTGTSRGFCDLLGASAIFISNVWFDFRPKIPNTLCSTCGVTLYTYAIVYQTNMI